MFKFKPRGLERWKLTDRSDVQLRPIRSGDAHYLIDIFEKMGPESRYQRFNTPVTNVSPERVSVMAEQMVSDSLNKGRGWLAFVGDEELQAVGGARYVRTDDHSAEIAISVRDDMQRRGLGTLLLLRLIQTAQRDDLHTLTGMAQAQNRGVWRLLERSGYPSNIEIVGTDKFFSMQIV